MRVASVDFVRDWERMADKAMVEPVTITRDGRDELVVLAAREYARLKQRDRRVVGPEDLTEEEIGLIAQSKSPQGLEHLNRLLDG